MPKAGLSEMIFQMALSNMAASILVPSFAHIVYYWFHLTYQAGYLWYIFLWAQVVGNESRHPFWHNGFSMTTVLVLTGDFYLWIGKSRRLELCFSWMSQIFSQSFNVLPLLYSYSLKDFENHLIVMLSSHSRFWAYEALGFLLKFFFSCDFGYF